MCLDEVGRQWFYHLCVCVDVVWVQCSRADCGKWRKLSEDVDPSVLPDDWICENNPGTATCIWAEFHKQMFMFFPNTATLWQITVT